MVEPVPVILWEGSLDPVPGAVIEVNGDIAMVANQQSTQMGIGIRTQTPDQVLTWEVREGSCADPGIGLIEAGLYPVLETDDVGEAEAEIQIARRITTTRSYHVQVRWMDGVETNLGSGTDVLSCGNFQRTTLN